MDKIKSIFNDLTGGDGKIDGDDLKNIDVNDLKAQAEDLGIGNLDISSLTKLDFPLDKTEIISSLKTAGVSDQLISLLEKVPDQVYETLEDLQAKLPF